MDATAQTIIPIRVNSIAEFLPVIPVYDGATSFEKFIYSFEEIADHCNWDEKDQIMAFKLKLSGDAKEFINSQRDLKTSKSLKIIIERFKERFASPRSIASCITRLTSAYQLPSEDARKFFSRLEGLSYDCVPEEDESGTSESYRLQLLLSAAKQGLRTDILRGIVSSGLNSYADFKKHALSFEESLLLPHRQVEASASCEDRSRSDPELVRLQKQIDSLTSAMSALQTSLQKNDMSHRNAASSHDRPNRHPADPLMSRQSSKCSRCGRNGHFSSNCYSPFCRHCKIYGHSFENCRSRHRVNSQRNRNTTQQAYQSGFGRGNRTNRLN